MGALQIKHLFGLQGVSKQDIRTILDNAKQFREILERPVKKVPSLRHDGRELVLREQHPYAHQF